MTATTLKTTESNKSGLPADSCVFCRIVAGTEPATVVREWEDAIAFSPRHPVTPGHLLVVPRTHVADAVEAPAVTGAVFARAAELAAERGLDSLNLITSRGAEATQTVYHLHAHLVPRREGDGLPLPWTPQQAQRISEDRASHNCTPE